MTGSNCGNAWLPRSNMAAICCNPSCIHKELLIHMEYSTMSLIPNRVFLIGERHIPAETMEKISDEHIRIFLKEPNPKKWPPDIAHLKKYLPHVEQMKWELIEIMEGNDILLADSLKKWSTAVWRDFAEKLPLPNVQAEDILDEIALYLKEQIGRFVLDRHNI